MSHLNRVFVTGVSALTAAGNSIEATWNALLNSQSGLGPITQWDLTDNGLHLAGELKDFKAAKVLPDRKLIKAISKQDAFGICAATQAVEDSKLPQYEVQLSDKDSEAWKASTGIYVGSPGNKYFQQDDFLPLLAKSTGNMKTFADNLFDEVHPMWLLRILPNNVLAYTGITYGYKGPNQNITNHAVSGTQALLEAFYAIQSGQAERAVVVAYDTIEPLSLFYYNQLGVLSQKHLKPFDKDHDGTILSEGAAAIVLESQESVERRGTKCYAELLGGRSATESAGIFSLDSSGKPLEILIQDVLHSLNLQANEIDCVIAHANGNQKSDISEAAAIREVFKSTSLPVSGFKWATGHSLCASGMLDAVLSCYVLKESLLPGIAHFDEAAEGCKSLNIKKETRKIDALNHVCMLNRGFGSMNACLVMKACE